MFLPSPSWRVLLTSWPAGMPMTGTEKVPPAGHGTADQGQRRRVGSEATGGTGVERRPTCISRGKRDVGHAEHPLLRSGMEKIGQIRSCFFFQSKTSKMMYDELYDYFLVYF